MKKINLLLFVLFLGCTACSKSSPSRKIASSSQPRPSWINNIPKSSKYKFYVGVSTSSESEKESIQKATQDAYNQAIREGFGVETKMEISSKETMTETIFSKNFQELSDQIKFVKFERKKIHIEKENNSLNVFILFRYPIDELKKEKKRIKKNKFNLGIIELEKGNIAKARMIFTKICNQNEIKGCYKLAELEYRQKNITQTKVILTKICNNGSMPACAILGGLEHKKGNITKARKLLTKACDGGVMNGCTGLGLIEDEKGNITKAKTLYAKACYGGYKPSGSRASSNNTKEMGGKTIILGDLEDNVLKSILLEHLPQFRYCYQKELEQQAQSFGGMVRLDFVIGASGHVTKTGLSSISGKLPSSVKGCVVKVLKGIRFPKSATIVEVSQPFNFYPRKNPHTGDMIGCYNLGILEMKKGNTAKARKLYTKACDGGVMKVCNTLGFLEHEKGNITKARILFAKACEGGVMIGCHNLGRLEHEKGNITKARILFAKACEGGVMIGCHFLGYLEDEKGNTAKAKTLYAKACDSGVMKGCNNLGLLEYEKGNTTKARKLLTKACDDGVMAGCHTLGRLEYDKGNTAKAKKLFIKACDGEVKNACLSLKRLPASI